MKYWSPPDTNFRPIRHSAVCDIPNEYSRIPNAQHHVPKAYQKYKVQNLYPIHILTYLIHAPKYETNADKYKVMPLFQSS